MGGFGALRLGAKYPDRFRGISAHSAVTTLGPPGRGDRASGSTRLPGFGQPDGTALHWLEINARAAAAAALRLRHRRSPAAPATAPCTPRSRRAASRHQYEEFAGGHDWPYWRLHLADTLRFFGDTLEEVGAGPVSGRNLPG